MKGALSLRSESLFCWAAALFPVGRDSVASLRRKRSGRPNPSSVFSSGVVLFDGVVRKEQAGLADTLGRPVPSRPLPLSQRCETKLKHVARKSASDGGLACYIGANTPYVARKTAFHAIFCATSSKFVIGSVDFHRILTCFPAESLAFIDFRRILTCYSAESLVVIDFHRILACFSVRSLIFLDFHRVCPCRQNLLGRCRCFLSVGSKVGKGVDTWERAPRCTERVAGSAACGARRESGRGPRIRRFLRLCKNLRSPRTSHGRHPFPPRTTDRIFPPTDDRQDHPAPDGRQDHFAPDDRRDHSAELWSVIRQNLPGCSSATFRRNEDYVRVLSLCIPARMRLSLQCILQRHRWYDLTLELLLEAETTAAPSVCSYPYGA